MVSGESIKAEVIAAVRNWVKSLPAGLARLEEIASDGEYVLRVVPSNSLAATPEFRISSHGTFGLYAGAGLRAEELPLSEGYVLEICEAFKNGRFEERRWNRSGVSLVTSSVLKLESGNLYCTERDGAFGKAGAEGSALVVYDSFGPRRKVDDPSAGGGEST